MEVGQEQRQRTYDVEVRVPEKYETYNPDVLYNEKRELLIYKNDLLLLENEYPQAQLLDVNVTTTLRRIVQYVAPERCCDRAQLEIEKLHTHQMIPDIYAGLLEQGDTQLAEQLKPYVKKLRCQFPNYHCPSPCGHPRINRQL